MLIKLLLLRFWKPNRLRNAFFSGNPFFERTRLLQWRGEKSVSGTAILTLNFVSSFLFEFSLSNPDVNECEEDTHSCHINATCTNTIRSYRCSCVDGFRGDGLQCQGKLTLKKSILVIFNVLIFFGAGGGGGGAGLVWRFWCGMEYTWEQFRLLPLPMWNFIS